MFLEEIIFNFISPSLRILGSCSYSNANIVKRMIPIFIQFLLVLALFLALAMASTVACCSGARKVPYNAYIIDDVF